MRCLLRFLGLVVFVFQGFAYSAQAQVELRPTDGHDRDWFGKALDFDGTTLFVGKPIHYMGSGTPAVHVFAWEDHQMRETAIIRPLDGEDDDMFGWDLSADADVLVVAAPETNFGVGAVYVFRNVGGTWTQEVKLSGTARESFGQSVDYKDGLLVVGANKRAAGALYSGTSYVFRYNGATWNQEAQLMDPFPVHSGLFGTDVAISGDVIAVVSSNPGASRAGTLHLFALEQNQWSIIARIQSDEIDIFDRMNHLACDENLIVAGPSEAGEIYFVRNDGGSWEVTEKINAGPDREFAFRPFAVSKDRLAAISLSPSGVEEALLFERGDSGWAMESVLSGPGGAARNVAFGENLIAIANQPEWGYTATAGAVFVYEVAASVAAETEPQLPTTPVITAMHPNPATRSVIVDMDLPSSAQVATRVIDVIGRQLRTVDHGNLESGLQRLVVDTSALPAGVYILIATAGKQSVSRPLVIAR